MLISSPNLIYRKKKTKQNKIAAAKKQCIFCVFCFEMSLHLRHSKSGITYDYKFGISVNTYQ